MSLIETVQSTSRSSALSMFSSGGASLPPTFYARFVKRSFDLCLAAIVAIPVMIMVLCLGLLVRLGGGPVFFSQTRIGRDGQEFRCWKIRTMVVDAEAQLQKHLAENPEAQAEWARSQKLKDDPRVTRLGAWLRKTSIDELPQLWNVIVGDMSFVGPRPVVREELDRYDRYSAAYLAMKPGITGLWQVSGRNSVCYDTRVKMDVAYYDQVSLSADLRILASTIPAVLRRTGI